MSRVVRTLLELALFGNFLFAQKPPEPKPAEPPEEDESLIPEKYSFNPLEAAKHLRTGNFYFKKGRWRAAAWRYEQATKWNPGEAEAWLKLGQAREKMKDGKGAREAYTKFLELAPENKEAASVKKKLAGKL